MDDGDSTDRRRQFADEVRGTRPDLALLCLLVGTEADPSLGQDGIDAAQIELDRLAGLLPFGITEARDWAAALAELLGARAGFRGTAADYRHLESSLLHEVLRRRRGLPILLSVVWMEVARRAGAPVYGLALPGHFVIGFGDPSGPPAEQILADPFDGGRPLTRTDADLLVAGVTGAPLDPSMLTPADPQSIILRILNNIRAWAVGRPERTDVQLWAVELALLFPAHPARLRYEHAQLLVERGDFLRGAAELDEYAEVVAAVEPTAAETVRGQARSARARLN